MVFKSTTEKILLVTFLLGVLYWLVYHILFPFIFINYKGEGKVVRLDYNEPENQLILYIDYGSCDTWPWHITCVDRLREERNPIFTSIRKRDNQMLDTQLKGDLEVKDQFGNTPLFEAVLVKNLYAIEQLLKNGADMYVLDKYQLYTPFGYVCLHEDMEIVKLFLKYGVNVNYQYKNSETALMLAAKGCDHIGLMIALVMEGANLDLIDRYGLTIKDRLFRDCKNSEDYELMMRIFERQKGKL